MFTCELSSRWQEEKAKALAWPAALVRAQRNRGRKPPKLSLCTTRDLIGEDHIKTRDATHFSLIWACKDPESFSLSFVCGVLGDSSFCSPVLAGASAKPTLFPLEHLSCSPLSHPLPPRRPPTYPQFRQFCTALFSSRCIVIAAIN